MIAHGRTDDEVNELIGADWIVYQDLQDLVDAGTEGNGDIKRFECSVFDGQYITGSGQGLPGSYRSPAQRLMAEQKMTTPLMTP